MIMKPSNIVKLFLITFGVMAGIFGGLYIVTATALWFNGWFLLVTLSAYIAAIVTTIIIILDYHLK